MVGVGRYSGSGGAGDSHLILELMELLELAPEVEEAPVVIRIPVLMARLSAVVWCGNT